jgi:hypothetical protein
VAAGAVLGLGQAVDVAPAADDTLDVHGGAGAGDGEEPLLGLGVATRVRARTFE